MRKQSSFRADGVHVAIGKRLRHMRHFFKYTQERLGGVVNVTDGAIHHYEIGRIPLPTDVGLRLCRRLCFDERWLATGVGHSRPGVDLMSHPDYLEVDAREPLSSGFERLKRAYQRLSDQEPSMSVERLIATSSDDPGRMAMLLDWIQTQFCVSCSPLDVAQIYAAAARAMLNDPRADEALNATWRKELCEMAREALSPTDEGTHVSGPRRTGRRGPRSSGGK